MKYLLKKDYALRAYTNEYKIVEKDKSSIVSISKETFETLCKCDGIQEIDPETFKENFWAQEANGEIINDWQKPKYYNNRYLEDIQLGLTSKCNLNCRHCFNAKDLNRSYDEWSFEDICKLIKDAQEMGVLYFRLTGGEPLLHPRFLDVVKEIYSRGMRVADIVTNGFLVDQNLLNNLKLIDPKIEFCISFDCIEHHDWMRGVAGAEKRTFDAIELCINNGFRVMLNTQVNKVTYDTLFRTAKFFDRLGVSGMRVIKTTEAPRWKDQSEDLSLSAEEYLDICIDLLRQYVAKQRNMNLYLWQFGDFYPRVREYSLVPLRSKICDYNPNEPCCYTRVIQAYVEASGVVYPCQPVSGRYKLDGITCLNAKTLSLKEIWEDEFYTMKSLFPPRKLEELKTPCSKCKHFKQCAGGCRALSLVYNKDELGPNYFSCAFFKGNYFDKLKEILPNWYTEIPLEGDS